MKDTLQSKALIDALTKERRRPFLVSDALGTVGKYVGSGLGVGQGAILGAAYPTTGGNKKKIALAVLGALLGGGVGMPIGDATGSLVGAPVDLIRHWIYD